MVEDEFSLPRGASGAIGCLLFVLAGIVVVPVSTVVLAYAHDGGWRVVLLAVLFVGWFVSVGVGIVTGRFLAAALLYAGATAVSFGLLAMTG